MGNLKINGSIWSEAPDFTGESQAGVVKGVDKLYFYNTGNNDCGIYHNGTSGYVIRIIDNIRTFYGNITGDANTLDGYHAASFALVNHTHNYLTWNINNNTPDFNSITTTAFNSITSASTNSPTPNNHGILLSDFNVGTPFQIWWPDNNMQMYKRFRSSGTWSDWSNTWEINITGNAISATSASYLLSGNTKLQISQNVTAFMWMSLNGKANWGTERDYTAQQLYEHYYDENGTYIASHVGLNTGNCHTWCAPASHTHDYLPRSGGSIYGALTFANNTWNLLGDDVWFGDANAAGAFCIKGANGTTNLKFYQYDGGGVGTISFDAANNFNVSHYIIGTISSATNADNARYATSAGSASKASGYRYFLGTGYSWESGILINCCAASAYKMVAIHITGNGYGMGTPIDTWFNFYDYTATGSTIINSSGINNGCYIGPLRVYIHSGRVWAWFAQSTSYQTINVEVITNTESDPSMGHSYFHESGYSHLTTIYPQTSVKSDYGSSLPSGSYQGQVFFLT